ncbi:MAG: aminoacetone oxidase family FAD-binding enzyme [Clostridia bacterium]|nr:aminoacetone oxidase family FAD-binding enzyme [Clostridia bacterium]
MQKYDVIIIGGGAAGMCAAINIKMRDRSISVAILEQLSRVGKKLITTGNGRCNISNMQISLDRYHGENINFAEYALTNFDNYYAADFFSEIGVMFTYDEKCRAYPYSLQASSVVDALRFAIDEYGVDIFIDTTVKSYLKQKNQFVINTNNGDFIADNLIIATGLYSGGQKLGSNGSMVEILKKSGYKVVKTTPAIVQLKTDTGVVKGLKGIKVNADATLIINGNAVRSDFGEVLFCDYGLSGPPIMQISREVERVKGDKFIILDLMPEYSFANICDMLQFRVSALYTRNLDEFLSGMLNKRVGQAVLKLCGLKLSESVSGLEASDIKQIASVIKGMKFKVVGTTGFDNSQVTAGGLDTNQFNNQTMMSKRERGLYCIGEILDIDGDCGGFNLQWAWSSAICAANSICNDFGV